jgi:outer membrane protein TolC
MRVHRDPHPRLFQVLRTVVATSLTAAWCVPAVVSAESPPQQGSVPPTAIAQAAATPTLTLQDCLSIGRTHQPSLQAASASLGTAQAAQRGLNAIRFGSRLSRELPIRKQQSAHGIAAATANLEQVRHDVDASIARLYYSVIYAQEQLQVAEEISARLQATVAVGETLLGQRGAPPDLNALSIERAKLFRALAQSRVDEAKRGLNRAKAALREAMGVGDDFPFDIARIDLPQKLSGVDKDEIVRLAQCYRGEVAMAQHGVAISQLEMQAQAAMRRVKRPTAAAAGDVHSRPVPTGSFGDDYKPGAIGFDFPTLFVGPREIRVQRAAEVTNRSAAAADKAKNLVTLEAEDTYYRWEETVQKIAKFTQAAKDAEELGKRASSALESGVIQSYRDVLEILVLGAQIRANLNEARYNHAVALTELERVTGGAFLVVTGHTP